MQRIYVDSTIRYADALQQEIDTQERYLNPFIEPLKCLLDFEKIAINKVKSAHRVYELLLIIQEARKARMQVGLRLLDCNLIR